MKKVYIIDAQGNRVPDKHGATHAPGGRDALAIDAAAGTGSLRTIGTGALQAAAGNDARLSDSRAPTGSASGDLAGTYPGPTLAAAGPGATGPLGGATVAPIVTIDAKGRVTALSSATITGVVPSAHATSHKTGGSDAIKLDELSAPTDITTLNASASAHGLLPKLSNASTDFLNGTGAFSVPPGAAAAASAELMAWIGI